MLNIFFPPIIRFFAISLLFLFFAFCCTEKTSEPECDGDGENNGCPSGEYCATDNTCQQDCTANVECSNNEECTDNGECVPCDD